MPTLMPAPSDVGASWYAGTRPITIAVLAMGGEGGGVLADWIVAVAEKAGYHAQTTSVAGVAQRTGATVYYAELYPAVSDPDGSGRPEPVLSVFPAPGEVDLVVASELMECGRAVQRGFATPDRTTLIASTNRVYSIDEKMHLGDGRVDSDELLAAAGRAARRLVTADFAAIAGEHRSVISAALFGAVAASGVMPFERAAFEQAIHDAGKGVEPSLAAFGGGFGAARAALDGAGHGGAADHGGTAGSVGADRPAGTVGVAGDAGSAGGTARAGRDTSGSHSGSSAATAEGLAPAGGASVGVAGSVGADGSAAAGTGGSGLPGPADVVPAPRRPTPVDITIGMRPISAEERKAADHKRRNEIAATDPESLVGSDLRPLARTVSSLPPACRSTVLHGLVRCGTYQDLDYAQRYLDRVAAFAAADPDPLGDALLTTEAARHLALWMCYQDTIHVAWQKTRQRRLERVRDEAGVTKSQLSRVHEYLHPQASEITDTLPYRLGKILRRSKRFTRAVDSVTRDGMVLDTTSVRGYAMLTTMARMRPLRPRSLRFVEEQRAIDTWTAFALEVAGSDADLAVEIVVCQKVLKGYGATYAHGDDSFALLMTAAKALHAGGSRASGTPAEQLARLRSAALSDEDGATLRARLGDAGLPVVKEK